MTPSIDGSHNLTVILTDNTIGAFPNIVERTFFFLVDNIILNFSRNEDFIETTHAYVNTTDLVYGDNISYVVIVTDAINFTEIIGLEYRIVKDFDLNISVEVHQLDNVTYEICVSATNVTGVDPTKIEIQFFKFTESKQLIHIFLNIDKKEGILNIDQRSIQEVTYEDNITIIVNLKNDIDENETIIKIVVISDQGITEMVDFEYLGEDLFKFNYSSIILQSKGNFTLLIGAESNFYYGYSNYDIEINPLSVELTVEVENYEILEGAQLVITGQLTLINGTPIPFVTITVAIYIVEKSNSKSVFALDEADFDRVEYLTADTDIDGYYQVVFQMSDDIDYVEIEVSFGGSDIYDIRVKFLNERVYVIAPPGLPSWLLYTIIGGSLLVAIIVSFLVYKLTRRKPFEDLMEEITDEEISSNYSLLSPGVILSIFDQKKGPVPLLMNHSLKSEQYARRLRTGEENFLLKISDQAYSSLGFEEHDVGRRVGSIVLPGEKMIGWVHGIQLPNKAARGGFENLILIVLADSDNGKNLLNYQEFLCEEADEMISDLKSQKDIERIKELIKEIRHKSVRIMLAAQKIEKTQNGK
jgi:hypothetical protein